MNTWSESHATSWVGYSYNETPLFKIGGNRSCGIGDILVVTWTHVTLHGWVRLTISRHPSQFGGHTLYGRGNITFLICHVTSRDLVIGEWVTSWVGALYSMLAPWRPYVSFCWKHLMTCVDLCPVFLSNGRINHICFCCC